MKATRPGTGVELVFNGQPIEISSAERPAVQARGRGALAQNPGLAAAIDRLQPGEWFIVPGSGALENKARTKLIVAIRVAIKKNAMERGVGVAHGGVMVWHSKPKGRA